jgi:hypothetical protein
MQPDNRPVSAMGHHRTAADITELWTEELRAVLPGKFLKYEKNRSSHLKSLVQRHAALPLAIFLESEEKSLQAGKVTKRLQGARERGLNKVF